MSEPQSSSEGRVLRFRQRRSDDLIKPGDPPGEDTLAKFADRGEPDDYRHRMMTNAAAVLILALLIGAGLWLANTMADMRKNQDCVLSGRAGCAPIDIPHDRW